MDEISSLTKIIIARPNWSRSLRNVVGNLNWPSGNELSSFVSEIIKTSMFTSTSSVNKSNLFLNEWATIKWIINEQFKWAIIMRLRFFRSFMIGRLMKTYLNSSIEILYFYPREISKMFNFWNIFAFSAKRHRQAELRI